MAVLPALCGEWFFEAQSNPFDAGTGSLHLSGGSRQPCSALHMQLGFVPRCSALFYPRPQQPLARDCGTLLTTMPVWSSRRWMGESWLEWFELSPSFDFTDWGLALSLVALFGRSKMTSGNTDGYVERLSPLDDGQRPVRS